MSDVKFVLVTPEQESLIGAAANSLSLMYRLFGNEEHIRQSAALSNMVRNMMFQNSLRVLEQEVEA